MLSSSFKTKNAGNDVVNTAMYRKTALNRGISEIDVSVCEAENLALFEQ